MSLRHHQACGELDPFSFASSEVHSLFFFCPRVPFQQMWHRPQSSSHADVSRTFVVWTVLLHWIACQCCICSWGRMYAERPLLGCVLGYEHTMYKWGEE